MSADPVRCPNRALKVDRENEHRAYLLLKIPVGHTPEDVLRPEYFGHQAESLRVLDVIDFISEDATWEGSVVVRAIPVGTHMVITKPRWPIAVYDTEDLPDGWDIQFLGGSQKHTILRGEALVKGEFDTREEAFLEVLNFAGKEKAASIPVAAAPSILDRKKPGPKPKTRDDSPPPPPA